MDRPPFTATEVPTSSINVEKLLEFMLNTSHEVWRRQVRILANYMPPYPGPDTKPKAIVLYHPPTDTFLRHSRGPHSSTFWDVYGDDFHSAELALWELSKAPTPSSCVIEFSIPLKDAKKS